MLGRCGLGAGRCSKTCASIQVTEHTACTCGCGSRGAEQCSLSDTHVWSPDTCTCSCRDFQVMFHPKSHKNGIMEGIFVHWQILNVVL